VIYTSDGTRYLHLPGIIVTENGSGERRYLLSDGLGSVRQVVDEQAELMAYQEYDPYGNPRGNGSQYGFTGEWWSIEAYHQVMYDFTNHALLFFWNGLTCGCANFIRNGLFAVGRLRMVGVTKFKEKVLTQRVKKQPFGSKAKKEFL